MKRLQPSMSKADLLLACQWPWGKEVEEEDDVGEAARFGSAYHAVMARHLTETKSTSWKLECSKQARHFDVDGEELQDHFARTAPVLIRWLGDNPYQIDFGKRTLEVETSLAMMSSTHAKGRRCSPCDERHFYPDAKPGELPGTLDLVSFAKTTKKHLLVIDHKTGADVGDPVDAPQLLSQATAAVDVYGATGDVLIGYFHAPRGGAATVYVDNVSQYRLDQHAVDVAVALARVGDGSLRPGPQCTYCPAFSICPAQANALAELRGSTALTLSPEAAGKIYEKKKTVEKLLEIVDRSIRESVRAHGHAVLQDGTLEFVKRPSTNLSMSSIERKLGKVEGGKLIEKLDKLGVIERGEREELRPVKEKGR